MAPEPTPQAPATEIEQPSFTQSGLASWYGTERRGRVTASGEHFDPRGLTAAHLTLPIGTVVRVTSADTGKSIKVRINDRGPHARNRIIDLSAQAAAALDLRGEGVGAVTLAVYAADQ
jgi:rare lipoprotein A